jgi:hypothetical protein
MLAEGIKFPLHGPRLDLLYVGAALAMIKRAENQSENLDFEDTFPGFRMVRAGIFSRSERTHMSCGRVEEALNLEKRVLDKSV